MKDEDITSYLKSLPNRPGVYRYFDLEDEQNFSTLREYFHKADEDDNGIIDIDEFLSYVEETTFQD